MARPRTIHGWPKCGSSTSHCTIGQYYAIGGYLVRPDDADEFRDRIQSIRDVFASWRLVPSSVNAASADDVVDDRLFALEHIFNKEIFGNVCTTCGKSYDLISGQQPYIWKEKARRTGVAEEQGMKAEEK